MKEFSIARVLSLTYKTLNSSRPAYLHSLVTLNRTRLTCWSSAPAIHHYFMIDLWCVTSCVLLLLTRSPSLVTLNCPSNPSHLQITNKSLYYTASDLWSRLPPEFRQLAPLSSTSSFAICLTLFHKKLTTHLFHSSFAP